MRTNRQRQVADPQSLLLGAQRQQRPMSDIMFRRAQVVALQSAKIPTCAFSVLSARISRCHNATMNVGNEANVDNLGMDINGSTLSVEAQGDDDTGNLAFAELNLYGTFKAENITNALGFANDFTVNFGDITQESCGVFDFSGMTGKLWFNSHTITVTADATVSGRGTMTLISFAGNTDATAAFDTTGIAVHDAFGESLTLNASAETLDGLAEGEFAVLAGNSGVSIIYNVAAVPEPSSFGLLAGLGAIALAVSRRKRR